MTTQLRPGCFGSAIFYREGAPECLACSQRDQCKPEVKRAQTQALKAMSVLDIRFGTERSVATKAWWKDRWKADARPQARKQRAARFVEQLSAHGLNVFLLRNKENPVPDGEHYRMLREACAFVLSAGPFKPRDMMEHLRETCADESKKRCTSFAKDLCDALEWASVVKKEKGGVLCLQS